MPLVLQIGVEKWPLKAPFRIAGRTTVELDVVVVTLEQHGLVGRGEAAGVHYRGETASSMVEQVESARAAIETGINWESLRQLLPSGGARNAVDCALWDLRSKADGCPVWEIAGLEKPRPLLTTFTCSAGEPDEMAAAARAYKSARAIKLKLTGEPTDAERVRAVREARGDVWLGVDANQSLDRAALERLMPVLVQNQVSLIEQPFPISIDAALEGFRSPIPIAADESAQDLSDLPSLVGRFDVVNIELDKCGGLTEGLKMARAARELGLGLMVGNMRGTSLAMAPAFLLGQLCYVVDLDGPIFLRADRPTAIDYVDGCIRCPEALWGAPVKMCDEDEQG